MMARIRVDGSDVVFDCPGCGGQHRLNIDPTFRPCWSFNGDTGRPTLSPSINAFAELGPERRTWRCHSFVREGRIQFLHDCTHSLVGQTVDLPEVPA
ncbi:DUF6527 family protein [Psychromarinibacter halotolerans]|uniref:DUF6527 family protein n=1 Tax=Psychromarinibacter halotolerans TaxID=1775175 RepID=A0ABV7GUT8_9RHOB|nr:DUF6527 family protein [Psychromarinibacter halotolerans]MDF0598452.1 DUF6527 family protein [Psychromarinibacter halotolerans]